MAWQGLRWQGSAGSSQQPACWACLDPALTPKPNLKFTVLIRKYGTDTFALSALSVLGQIYRLVFA